VSGKPKARPVFSATLSRRQPLLAPSFLQIFSKPFPNFLQIFGGFLQAFPNFPLAVLGNFRGLEGKKFGERTFRVSPNFFPQTRLEFPHGGAPTAAVEANRGVVFICQTAEIQCTPFF
jgi:hypothetical protein